MKIGILTLHRANNYGAVLQCYALQETLRSLGHDVRIIDYRQPDTEQSYQVFSWAKLRQSSGNVRSFLKALLYIPYSFVQQKGFNRFRKRYLKTTLPVWRADDMPQDMDVYVIGSDQLWSVQCMGGHLEPVFFGQFPHPEKSCVVGYAISSNIPSLQTIGVDRIKQYLASFRCISLREASICSWIKEQTGFSVRQDIDPTMLLDPKQWDAFVGSKPIKDDYVLMYFLLPQQKKLAEEFARKQGLRLIEVGKVAFSPEKFLTYVKHATYVLGGSSVAQNNPLGILTRNGYVEREYSYLQSDFTLDVDLNKWVRGLSIRPSVTFDLYNEYSAKKDGGYSVYELIGGPDDEIASYKQWGYDNPNTKQARGAVATNRNWAFNTTVNYDREIGKHDISALAVYFMQQQDFNDQIHSLRRVNAGIWANYMYDKTYVVDVSLNCVGVPSFAPDKRFGVFPTVGAGWIMSENSFMENVDWVDFLKLRASYGILGSTSYTEKGIVSNYYYRTEWAVNGTYPFTSFNNIVNFNQTGNPNIGFQKSHEFNAGVDFEFFDHSFSGSVGYFRNVLDGGLANLTDITPGVSGKGGALVWYNYKEYLAQGAEAELYYTKRFGDFQMTVGGNFTYGYSEVTREADIEWPDELGALAKVRRDGDTKGYQVIGTFKDQADIDASPKQTFGKVYPGDLKYRDINSDGIIDERDRDVIANVQPSVSYGITVSLKYKGFNLDILGYGLAGFDRMLTNKYYQIYGDRKYSNVVYTGLPNGNPHPVLRADSSTNNFVDSDYWVVNGGYFKLRNVEFGYTLPYKASKKIGLNMLKFFVRGTNLFTISKIKDLDPESLNAGVGDFPLATTITGGLSFSF